MGREKGTGGRGVWAETNKYKTGEKRAINRGRSITHVVSVRKNPRNKKGERAYTGGGGNKFF